jgi:superfamily I DNA/RNA helicase/RecB family exonuclease
MPFLARPRPVQSRGPGALVELDAGQRAVVDAVVARRDQALLVLGAPGTGKTTVALEAAVAAGLAPQEVLVLAASRRLAADLRDRLAARWPHTADRPLVQTPAAAAFAVLRARAAARGEPSPVLVSGPEQDQVLAELLAGHAAGEGVPMAWPDTIRADALPLRAFRDELRDLLMRAAERGLAPDDLARLGREQRRPEWAAAARLYEEYLDVMWLRTGTPDLGARLDPAVVVDEAARALLTWDDEVERTPRPAWRLVIVDDHQESTAATARLLRVLADDGARLVLLADPDAAVQGFRGADPALVGRAAAPRGTGSFGARVITLPTVWRHGPALRDVVGGITERIGAVAGAEHRRAEPAVPDGPSPRVAVLAGAAQEAAYVAHLLREAHLEDGVAWGDMAVVARSGERVTSLRRALAVAGVPVSVLGSQVPLRDEPAVRPLLDVLAVVTGRVALDAAAAAGLALSPVGALDAVGLRRVRRALRAEELGGGGGRASDELLVEALEEPGVLVGLRPEVATPMRRLARVIAAGRAAALEAGADAHSVLWAVWDATGLAEQWRRAALAGGAAGQRADRDLDAVLALFRAAETFVERMPAAPPRSFVDWLVAQDVPADTIAARARRESVPVLTAAGAAGREWELVVVAGVQEGSWPDLRLRDSLLGAQALVDLLDGRAGDGAAPDVAAARRAVLADELRSFAVACSRARSRLVVTAVADLDSEPSPFVDLVVPPAAVGPAGEEVADARLVTAMPAPLDLRGLVARLRSRLEETARDGAPDAAAAHTLARLGAAGVDGADPVQWHGLAAPSTDEALWPAEARVPVSPSRIELAATCALRWALESAGGTPVSTREQSLGTLIHAIAQDHPSGTYEELIAALDDRWSTLGLHGGWPEAATRRKAEGMVCRLAAYLRGAGAPLLVEADFVLETDRAVVKGKVDRIEAVPPAEDGTERARVVDLKTGSQVTGTKAEVNPQLAAYQLAVGSGSFEGLAPGTTSAGATLLYVGAGAARNGSRKEQSALDGDRAEWANQLIDGVAESMAASTFRATRNDDCRRCPVRSSCPVQPEGGQVTR